MPLPQSPGSPSQRGQELLRIATGVASATFRNGQWEAIDMLVRQRSRLLVVQRTGWGKSFVYFIATRLLREAGSGPAILISPLLALMRNQIEAAARMGVRAETINSVNPEGWENIKKRILADEIDILLVSPERLAKEEFQDTVLAPLSSRLGLFVVDEAHCISDWGHDFRPDYRRIVRILQAMPPNIPILATTATANQRVVDDVTEQLGKELQVIRGPLVRKSLCLQTLMLESPAARLAWLAEHLHSMPGSGIIYTLTIRDANNLSAWLRVRGIDAPAYHKDIENATREELEQRLQANQVKALVATTALGMGYDKPDLGFVIHFQRPGSVIHYYQQVGRAGRGIDKAIGILLSGREDDDIIDYFIRTAFPPLCHEEAVLDVLHNAEDGLSVPQMEEKVNLSQGQIKKVLDLLSLESPAPVSKQGSRWYLNPVQYTPDRSKAEALLDIRKREQAVMTEYMVTRGCLMNYLAQELDDPQEEPCGRCMNCLGSLLVPDSFSHDLAKAAVDFLRRSEIPIAPRKHWAAGNPLAEYGWTGRQIPEELLSQEGRCLCVWGDAGWGDMVRKGKQTDHRFDDALVEGVVDMIRSRWLPDPSPAWVTCVPSLNHPELVPDFASRVAKRLGVPFVPCIRKVRVTDPQKLKENSFQQASNLNGAFEVDSDQVHPGPVFLVDDMVDSGWTLTVLAALLREAGSGAVFPLALASTRKK